MSFDSPLLHILEMRAVSLMSGAPSDYQEHRRKVTNQIGRLRKELKIQLKTVKGSKTIKGKADISLESLENDPRYSELIIFSMERLWAQAMETKAMLEVNSSASGRRHVISKLAKALKYYKDSDLGSFTKLDSNGQSPLWKLEVVVYKSLLAGQLAFEQHRWTQASQKYSEARTGLTVVAEKSKNDALKEMIGETISATVDPSLRFSVYQTQSKRDKDIPTLARALAQKADGDFLDLIKDIEPSALSLNNDQNPSAELGEIEWRQHKATVQDPDLASAILQARKVDSSAQSIENVEEFDSVLQSWQDCVDKLHEIIEKAESSGNADQKLYIVSSYLRYNLIFRRIQRDMLIISHLEKKQSTQQKFSTVYELARDKLRIYGSISQSCAELLELPGVFNDEALHSSLTTVKKYYEALGAVNIAEAYSLNGQRSVSLSIYESLKTTITSDDVFDIQTPGDFLSKTDIQKLALKLESEAKKTHALASVDYFHSVTQKSAVSTDISRYPSGSPEEVLSNIVELNGKLLPVPVKPVFFDIAFNYIAYNEKAKDEVLSSSTDKHQQQQQQDTPSKKKGFLGGMWGR